MDTINPELRELTLSIKKLITEYSKVFPPARTTANLAEGAKKNPVNDESFNTTRNIAGYFEAMLGSTKGMLINMGMMDSGFAKTVQLILQILSSIGGGSGGFGGIFSGLLGVIGGLVGGPLGAAAGGGIGSILGRSSLHPTPLNTGLNTHNYGSNSVVNQVIIKNPVTFTKAFDVEVRTRTLRGGIDL